MRISNKIPIFSFYYRSQVEMLYLKIKVVFSLNFFFSLVSSVERQNGNLFSFVHIWLTLWLTSG